MDKVGALDETLGPGAGSAWGAGEGTDYLLRALDHGFCIYFDPAIEVQHPRAVQDFESHRAKSYSYAMGKGRVLRLRECRPFEFRSSVGPFLDEAEFEACQSNGNDRTARKLRQHDGSRVVGSRFDRHRMRRQ